MNALRNGSIAIGLIALPLAGCATPDPLEGERTVFTNPYAVPAIDRTGVGPQCDVDLGQDATCLGAALVYDGRGRYVLLGNGEAERLTRHQRRILRERAELLESLRNAPAVPQAPPPPPIVGQTDEAP